MKNWRRCLKVAIQPYLHKAYVIVARYFWQSFLNEILCFLSADYDRYTASKANACRYRSTSRWYYQTRKFHPWATRHVHGHGHVGRISGKLHRITIASSCLYFNLKKIALFRVKWSTESNSMCRVHLNMWKRRWKTRRRQWNISAKREGFVCLCFHTYYCVTYSM